MLTQSGRFEMKISPRDRAILAELARLYDRSRADTLRLIAREKWEALTSEEAANPPTATQPAKQAQY